MIFGKISTNSSMGETYRVYSNMVEIQLHHITIHSKYN